MEIVGSTFPNRTTEDNDFGYPPRIVFTLREDASGDSPVQAFYLTDHVEKTEPKAGEFYLADNGELEEADGAFGAAEWTYVKIDAPNGFRFDGKVERFPEPGTVIWSGARTAEFVGSKYQIDWVDHVAENEHPHQDWPVLVRVDNNPFVWVRFPEDQQEAENAGYTWLPIDARNGGATALELKKTIAAELAEKIPEGPLREKYEADTHDALIRSTRDPEAFAAEVQAREKASTPQVKDYDAAEISELFENRGPAPSGSRPELTEAGSVPQTPEVTELLTTHPAVVEVEPGVYAIDAHHPEVNDLMEQLEAVSGRDLARPESAFAAQGMTITPPEQATDLTDLARLLGPDVPKAG